MSAIQDGDSPNDIAHKLLGLVERGHGEAVTDVIEELLPPDPDRTDGRIEAVVLELLERAAQAAKGRTPATDLPADEPYQLELYDHSGEALTIDDVGPVPRAALRALLALLTDRRHDAVEQVALVLDNGSRNDAATLLTTSLLWSGADND
ncbi:hypothetical protein [Labedaea rhizosphaerae]|uniref:Uncharacterized protein n=1 Tax=Labedaea rhizosphaerae TaxID=598644 RepID=A0A4R6SGU3_LABRH|nr:hypothetical protein [Labedaea rhizosphaerae]TDQ00740.1 hypothetical protein EV186_102606 [Labedaea rhizosphaerae]